MLDLETIKQRVATHPALNLDPDERLNHAAVAVIIRPSELGLEVLLIKRREDPRDRWSGQMAFPGGKADETDPSLEATARREALEEVGLDLRRDARLLGKLDDLPAIARAGHVLPLIISPFVYRLTNDAQLTPVEQEVEDVVWVPLNPMYRGELDDTYHHPVRDSMLPFRCYTFRQYTIWGLTYQMLQGFFGLMRNSGG